MRVRSFSERLVFEGLFREEQRSPSLGSESIIGGSWDDAFDIEFYTHYNFFWVFRILSNLIVTYSESWDSIECCWMLLELIASLLIFSHFLKL